VFASGDRESEIQLSDLTQKGQLCNLYETLFGDAKLRCTDVTCVIAGLEASTVLISELVTSFNWRSHNLPLLPKTHFNIVIFLSLRLPGGCFPT
jgi:hypothetical protein